MMRACGVEHDGLCGAEMGQVGPSDKPEGFCDDCGRVVRPSGRGITAPAGTPVRHVMELMLRMAAGQVPVCPTCGQVEV